MLKCRLKNCWTAITLGGTHLQEKILFGLIEHYRVKVSHVAVFKWIRKHIDLIKSYVDTLTPNTSGIRHTDEMKAKDNV
ncbi:MAG: hypothetical protein QW429_05395 [Thermoprotei archaeon]